MYALEEIKDSLTEVVDAIRSVLNLDLTIVDQRLNRIIATGKYKYDVGKKIDNNSAFSYAIKHKKSFIIDNPKYHPACLECSNKDACKEAAEICSPIKINDEVIGIIGLIAFDVMQKKKIIENDTNILKFLDKMSELIATKVIEKEKTKKLITQSKEMNLLINAIDRGIILINTEGEILRYNKKASLIFDGLSNSHSIREVFSENYTKLLEETKEGFQNEIIYKNHRYLFKKNIIYSNNKAHEMLLEFDEIKSLINVINDIVGDKQMTFFDDIIGETEILNEVKVLAKKALNSPSTVLLQGETGVGKELFARGIHFEGKRKNKPFITINCAAIPDNLLESELFGYTEGSFTGGKKGGKIGKFELAKNGTIFLDEIGELPIYLQSKLLRVIQEKRIMRIGGSKVIDINCRIIAATNRDLKVLVEKNEFREDLYYRLNVIPITIPPLRKRKEDIPLLIECFINNFSDKLEKNVTTIDLSAKNVLENYMWPGNIRELENTIEYAVNMCDQRTIQVKDLPPKLKESEKNDVNRKVCSLQKLEKREIIKAIEVFKGDYALAYKTLGISRATFYRKLKKYGIDKK